MVDWVRLVNVRAKTGAGLACTAGVALLMLSGCASPGPALPPSLKLPDIVTDLAAVRVGNEVRLSWTTPSHTTDGLNLAGTTTAEICRRTIAGAAGAAQAVAQPCAPILQVLVRPGPSKAVNLLQAALTTGTPTRLAYRVQLRSKAGRTAGPSAEVFAVSGPAPTATEGLRATATKGGAMLEWQPEGGEGPANGREDVVELDRTVVEVPRVAGSPSPQMNAGKGSLLAAPKEPIEVNMLASSADGRDPGGAMDRTAKTGKTYRYTAQRVRTVVLGVERLEVRSPESASVTVAMLDVFPPDAPIGLVAAPGFAADSAGVPVIDLSWEPAMEVGLAGYRVYRREADAAWQLLRSELVSVPSYRDATVVAGRRYTYRVTAVGEAGSESVPGGLVEETAPSR